MTRTNEHASEARQAIGAPPPAFCRLRLDTYELEGFGPVRTSLWRLAVADKGACGEANINYALCIKGCGKRSFCYLGQDEAFARDLYRRLVEGRVSPTNARELLRWELAGSD
ncbi:MAG: hypothetical protein IIX90_00125 [Clostridia bacterium]|nr:hypothetical protein [Clostridia bacterium]